MRKIPIFILMLSCMIEAKTGEQIYKKCTGCHGLQAQQKFHPKASAIIHMSSDKRLKAMQRYKAGNNNKYGMGSVMRDMLKSLSDDEIFLVNEYINSLKNK
ncbi:c-type cytochrome [Campylobacter majalis]|uniref:c-type cytochrome n=1 Tax=Campylobacter majalis TaxID=2790656 RepID=UPI003D694DF3